MKEVIESKISFEGASFVRIKKTRQQIILSKKGAEIKERDKKNLFYKKNKPIY